MSERIGNRVLVVDDNPALCGVMRFSLERAGVDVRLARNGREACRLLGEWEFDLVVTDYQMPEMNGEELCRYILTAPKNRQIPVIMVTAKELEIDLPSLREKLGIVEVFGKPFSPRELTGAVLRHLMLNTAM